MDEWTNKRTAQQKTRGDHGITRDQKKLSFDGSNKLEGTVAGKCQIRKDSADEKGKTRGAKPPRQEKKWPSFEPLSI